MPTLDYSTEGAIGRGIAEGLGKVQAKREADQLHELDKQWSIRAKAWEIEKMETACRAKMTDCLLCYLRKYYVKQISNTVL